MLTFARSWLRAARTIPYLTVFALLALMSFSFLTLQTPAAPKHASTPVIVVVDPGHGGRDNGAMGYWGLEEKTLTLAIARLLQLSAKGDPNLRIVLTRQTDAFISLQKRADMANRLRAVLYLSIHINAYQRDSRVHGIETLVPSDHDPLLVKRDLAFAKIVHGLLLDQLRAADRGIHEQRLYLHRVQMPAVLVEAGFITNPAEAQKLDTLSYQERIAQILLDGIKAYLHDSSTGG